ALIGRGKPTISESRTKLFVYRAEDGKKLANIEINPQTDSHAASMLADVDGDRQTDFIVARPIVNGDYSNQTGDVVAVGGAQQEKIWETKLNQPCALAVARFAGEKSARVFVTLRDGTLCALRGSDGVLLWTTA